MEVEEEGRGEEAEQPPPRSRRRFSLSDKLQAVSSRLWRFTSGADADGEDAAAAEAGGAASSAQAAGGEGGGAAGGGAAAAATFDEYLAEAGVQVESGPASAAAAGGIGKGVAGLIDSARGEEALSNRLMSAMVLSPELDQLR